ncbi:MAG: protoporphyrinogen/coproporphyrinogen oxidase [Oscillochloridaceae bacterium umkhey_bin13]
MGRSGHVVVIGAGLAGLAAARRLQTAGLQVTVIEREPTVGGRARTAVVEGCQIELGAEFLASFYTRTLTLIDELGLRHTLQRIPRSSAILRAGQLHPLWPSARVAFTHLVGTRGKLALSYLLGSLVRHGHLLDLQAFAQAQPIDDVSVSAYAQAHLSTELLEYVLQPPISGIFYWTPERTSRALLLLVLRAGLSRPTGLQLFTLRDGLGQLAQALAHELEVRTGVAALQVEPAATGGFQVHTQVANQPVTLAADGVVIATTATAVPTLLPWLDEARRSFFTSVTYSATINLAVGTRQPLPDNVYGLLFPRRETPFLASATVQTVKNPAAAPPGHDVICLHLSGPASVALWQQEDQHLARLMLADLQRLAPAYELHTPLQFQRLYRCPEALPEFDVGHFGRLRQFTHGLIEQPGITFAGDYLGGPFIEGAILSGEQAADRLVQTLAAQSLAL